MMERVVGAMVTPFVHSANAGFEENHAAPLRCGGDIAGHAKCVVPKYVFINPIAQFCRESQQG